jgi:hypothetical protein
MNGNLSTLGVVEGVEFLAGDAQSSRGAAVQAMEDLVDQFRGQRLEAWLLSCSRRIVYKGISGGLLKQVKLEAAYPTIPCWIEAQIEQPVTGTSLHSRLAGTQA